MTDFSSPDARFQDAFADDPAPESEHFDAPSPDADDFHNSDDFHAHASHALVSLSHQAREYMGQAKSRNTLRAYQADWRCFTAWCQQFGVSSLPATPQTVALYLSMLADKCKPATLQRRLSAISQAHQTAELETPTHSAPVRLVWAGIRRAKGMAQHGKAPAITAELRRMVDTLDESMIGVRDRALLLVGFAGAFRRSELVGLDIGDAVLTSEGITIYIRKGKTDQEGLGRKVGIPYGSRPPTCPVRALLAWKEKSGIGSELED